MERNVQERLEQEPFASPAMEHLAQASAAAKPIGASHTIKASIVLPPDTNHHGTMFGGKLMAYIDDVATIAATRHARRPVVTASTDSVDFLQPVKKGDAICLSAFVTWTSKTSMEVFVRVITEDLLSGERKVCATSFLTFVALGEDNRPTVVPGVIPSTPEERMLHESAPMRKEARRIRREESKKFAQILGAEYRLSSGMPQPGVSADVQVALAGGREQGTAAERKAALAADMDSLQVRSAHAKRQSAAASAADSNALQVRSAHAELLAAEKSAASGSAAGRAALPVRSAHAELLAAEKSVAGGAASERAVRSAHAELLAADNRQATVAVVPGRATSRGAEAAGEQAAVIPAGPSRAMGSPRSEKRSRAASNGAYAAAWGAEW